MKSIVRWAVHNTPGMNTLMVALLVIGGLSLLLMRREEFPAFELEVITVSVPYPGASPEEVEEGICLKIEEAVRSIDGIKKQTSIAAEGMGYLMIDLETSVDDVQRVLAEVRSEIDRISSFPELSDDPEIQQVTMRRPALRVSVLGPESQDPDAELKLRNVAEGVRDEILGLKNVSQASLQGARDFQIDVEVSEEKLREHGITLKDVAAILRSENVELPGGLLKADSEHVLLRGKNKRLSGAEIAGIPLISQPNGIVLKVGDLANVKDEFNDTVAISRVNGQPGLVISIEKTNAEDLLSIVKSVRKFVSEKEMPAGYSLSTWQDKSLIVQDRMDLLSRNGIQGLLLVFLMLAIFLEIRLAFWVAMGIPISVLGACAILIQIDQTLNMLSMFAFLMALGIVVDDAIVIGENIYAHRQQGKSLKQAAVDGTYEVFPSVVGSVATSIIAFIPLLFVTGIMGKFIGVMPVTIIAMLAISLFESVLILPGHLAHHDGWFFRAVSLSMYPLVPLVHMFAWLNKKSAQWLDWVVDRFYRPVLLSSIKFPAIAISAALTVLILSVGFVKSGLLPFVIFPKLDKNDIQAKVVFQDGTPKSVTDAATKRMDIALREVAKRHTTHDGQPIVKTVHRTVGSAGRSQPGEAQSRGGGSHVGMVVVELVDTGFRDLSSNQLLAEWRELAGEFPGAESVVFNSPSFGPGGLPIEFKLLAKGEHIDELNPAIEECKSRLSDFPGVKDVIDDNQPGKYEFQITVKQEAMSMGIPLRDLAETVRGSYYGEEVMRLQRGRHEVKLMVRYPDSQRKSFASFNEIRHRTPEGDFPITALAKVNVQRGDSEINRIDQMRAITISADVDESSGANARNITNEFEAEFMPILKKKYPNVSVRWEGQKEQSKESIQSMMIGLGIALVAMYILLTLQFTSYLQPLLIMMIIPFGAIGAIAGHAVLGLPVTMFSLFGLVALTGVVVNDSIVLIDFINTRIGEGLPLRQAVIEAGQRRFRPVLLTSVTTVAGLTPILMETSLQAQFLIPMATSLCFGIMTATVLVLLLVPTFYALLDKLFNISHSHQPPVEPDAA
jgi:hydrophobic/amphiphilic exporter-1 (mainly G- bacteria), HAE1 family